VPAAVRPAVAQALAVGWASHRKAARSNFAGLLRVEGEKNRAPRQAAGSHPPERCAEALGARILPGVSHPNIAHWDDVEEHDHEEGSIHSAWRYLGDATGTVGVGVNRIRVHPGCRSTPLHSHGDHEEIFFVLGGSGLSWQRTERGDDVICEVGPGTCLVQLAAGPAHTLVAGRDGLDVLAYGNARRSGAGSYDSFPRIEKFGIGPSLFDVDLTHQWELEGALPDPDLPEPGERPPNVVRLEDVEPELLDRGEFGDSSRELGTAAGSLETGLNHSDISPGKLNCPVHCHASEEEVFIVLEGDGVCILGEEEHPVRAGSVVARPPRTRVGHAFRAGADGMKLLAYGTREPNDIAWYPRSKKVYFRGVGLMTRLPELDYWDGE
jgi:uncharacterized cupin superfamily protein